MVAESTVAQYLRDAGSGLNFVWKFGTETAGQPPCRRPEPCRASHATSGVADNRVDVTPKVDTALRPARPRTLAIGMPLVTSRGLKPARFLPNPCVCARAYPLAERRNTGGGVSARLRMPAGRRPPRLDRKVNKDELPRYRHSPIEHERGAVSRETSRRVPRSVLRNMPASPIYRHGRDASRIHSLPQATGWVRSIPATAHIEPKPADRTSDGHRFPRDARSPIAV